MTRARPVRSLRQSRQAVSATDADGNLVYLATSVYNLQTTQKHWENVQFLTTREMGQKFN